VKKYASKDVNAWQASRGRSSSFQAGFLVIEDKDRPKEAPPSREERLGCCFCYWVLMCYILHTLSELCLRVHDLIVDLPIDTAASN
jgi:hypothetical protein